MTMSRHGKKAIFPPASAEPWGGRKAATVPRLTSVSATSPSLAVPSGDNPFPSVSPKPVPAKPGRRDAQHKLPGRMASIDEVEDKHTAAKPVLLHHLLLSMGADELPRMVSVQQDHSCDLVSLVRATVKKSSLSSGFGGMLSALGSGGDRSSLHLSAGTEKPTTHIAVSRLQGHRTLAAGLNMLLLSASLEDTDLDLKPFRLPTLAAEPAAPAGTWTSYESACRGKLPFHEYFLYEVVMDQSSSAVLATADAGGETSCTGANSQDTPPQSSSPTMGCLYDEDHIYQDLFRLLCSPLSSIGVGSSMDSCMRYRRRFIVPHPTTLPSGTVLPQGSELVVAASDEALEKITNWKSKEDLTAVGKDNTCVPCWLLERPSLKLASHGSRRQMSFIAVPLYSAMLCMPSDSSHRLMLQYAQLVEFMQSRDITTVCMHAFTYPLLELGSDLKQLFPSNLVVCKQEEVVERLEVRRHLSVLCASELELFQVPMAADLKLLQLDQSPDGLYRNACCYLVKLVAPSNPVTPSVACGSRRDSLPSWKQSPHIMSGSQHALPLDAQVLARKAPTLPTVPKGSSYALQGVTKAPPSSPTTTPRILHNVQAEDQSIGARDSAAHQGKETVSDAAAWSSSPAESRSPSPKQRSSTADSVTFDLLDDFTGSGTFEPVATDRPAKSPKKPARESFRASFLPWQRVSKARASSTGTSSTWFASALTSSEVVGGECCSDSVESSSPKPATAPSTAPSSGRNSPAMSDDQTGQSSMPAPGPKSLCDDRAAQKAENPDSEQDVNISRSQSFGGHAGSFRRPTGAPPKPPKTSSSKNSEPIADLLLPASPSPQCVPVEDRPENEQQQQQRSRLNSLTPPSYQGKPPPPQPSFRQRKQGLVRSHTVQVASKKGRPPVPLSRTQPKEAITTTSTLPRRGQRAAFSETPNAARTDLSSVAYECVTILSGCGASLASSQASSAGNAGGDASHGEHYSSLSTAGESTENRSQVVSRAKESFDDGGYALLGNDATYPVARPISRKKPAPPAKKNRIISSLAPTAGVMVSVREESEGSAATADIYSAAEAPAPARVTPRVSRDGYLAPEDGLSSLPAGKAASSRAGSTRQQCRSLQRRASASEHLQGLLSLVKPPGSPPPKRLTHGADMALTSFADILPGSPAAGSAHFQE